MAAAETVQWRELLTPTLAARTVVIWLGVWLNAADSLITATIMPSVGRSLGGYAYLGLQVARNPVGVPCAERSVALSFSIGRGSANWVSSST